LASHEQYLGLGLTVEASFFGRARRGLLRAAPDVKGGEEMLSSRTWSVRSAKLLQDEKLGSVLLRLMMAMNDIGVTNSSMVEWEKTQDPKKKARWRGGVLYFGRVQSAHLFEALTIIDEIKRDKDLMAAVDRADRATKKSFETVAKFLDGNDYKMMAKMRNVVAFHYEPKLTLRRLQKLVEKWPNHSMMYSLGSETLDWYFELGDLIADEIMVREVFRIPEDADIKHAVIEILDRLGTMAIAFIDFAGYFVRAFCSK
jgi:hypothetical protein